jgi:hypothetical protein
MANTIRIYKSKQAEELDEHLSGNAEQLRAVYEAALRRYEQYESQPLSAMVTELAPQDSVPWNPPTAEHFATNWSSEAEGPANADDVLRHGYREAVQLALSHEPPVPLETFWVSGAGDEFEVHISDGREHVTLFMVVPGVAGDERVPAGSSRAWAKSWVVTAGERTADGDRPDAQPLTSGPVRKFEVSGK